MNITQYVSTENYHQTAVHLQLYEEGGVGVKVREHKTWKLNEGMNELLLDLINKYQGETKMATQREKSRKHIDAHEAEINPHIREQSN